MLTQKRSSDGVLVCHMIRTVDRKYVESIWDVATRTENNTCQNVGILLPCKLLVRTSSRIRNGRSSDRYLSQSVSSHPDV